MSTTQATQPVDPHPYRPGPAGDRCAHRPGWHDPAGSYAPMCGQGYDASIHTRAGQPEWARLRALYDMTTPALVREFTGNRVAAARGEVTTLTEHDRHCAVVDELRRRGVLD